LPDNENNIKYKHSGTYNIMQRISFKKYKRKPAPFNLNGPVIKKATLLGDRANSYSLGSVGIYMGLTNN
jgi:hypothetical protein